MKPLSLFFYMKIKIKKQFTYRVQFAHLSSKLAVTTITAKISEKYYWCNCKDFISKRAYTNIISILQVPICKSIIVNIVTIQCTSFDMKCNIGLQRKRISIARLLLLHVEYNHEMISVLSVLLIWISLTKYKAKFKQSGKYQTENYHINP